MHEFINTFSWVLSVVFYDQWFLRLHDYLLQFVLYIIGSGFIFYIQFTIHNHITGSNLRLWLSHLLGTVGEYFQKPLLLDLNLLL